mmetsp:Transcript_38065/g.94435  ORF Transcript_38065/g.94435 Transcript_38065/m.94435 type:complete len:236 (-) Transcript_38065:345-1052(-)
MEQRTARACASPHPGWRTAHPCPRVRRRRPLRRRGTPSRPPRPRAAAGAAARRQSVPPCRCWRPQLARVRRRPAHYLFARRGASRNFGQGSDLPRRSSRSPPHPPRPSARAAAPSCSRRPRRCLTTPLQTRRLPRPRACRPARRPRHLALLRRPPSAHVVWAPPRHLRHGICRAPLPFVLGSRSGLAPSCERPRRPPHRRLLPRRYCCNLRRWQRRLRGPPRGPARSRASAARGA